MSRFFRHYSFENALNFVLFRYFKPWIGTCPTFWPKAGRQLTDGGSLDYRTIKWIQKFNSAWQFRDSTKIIVSKYFIGFKLPTLTSKCFLGPFPNSSIHAQISLWMNQKNSLKNIIEFSLIKLFRTLH
jgi:hypothetical protein